MEIGVDSASAQPELAWLFSHSHAHWLQVCFHSYLASTVSLCWRVGLRLLELALLYFIRSTWEFISPPGQILTNDWQVQWYKYYSYLALVMMNLRCGLYCLQTSFVEPGLSWFQDRVVLRKTLLDNTHLLSLLTLLVLFPYSSTSFSWKNFLLITFTWILFSEFISGEPNLRQR